MKITNDMMITATKNKISRLKQEIEKSVENGYPDSLVREAEDLKGAECDLKELQHKEKKQ